MSSFSITPITNIPPPAAQEFPDFIQFQSAGTDLGGPDASTLNFSTGLTATRGVGENSHVVTVTAGSEPPPASIPAGILVLESIPDPPGEGIFQFDSAPFGNTGWVTGTVVLESADWVWEDNRVRFVNAGIYRVVMTPFIQAAGEWPGGNTTYGTILDEETVMGVQARTHTDGDTNDSRRRMTWTDQTVITTGADVTWDFGLFALATDTLAPIEFAGMTLVIERLGDAP